MVWNIVFDSLLDSHERILSVRPKGYAEDGMFLVTGKDPDTLVDLAQHAINFGTLLFKSKYLKYHLRFFTEIWDRSHNFK